MTEPLDLETPACPLCSESRRESVYEEFKPHGVVRCRGCGLYYLSPRLTETAMLRLYAESDYYEGDGVGYSSYSEQADALRATFHRFLKSLHRRGMTGGSLLEVGCGCGYLLEQAAGFFAHRAGTEMSPSALEQARARADRVYEGSIEMVPTEARFDCIVLLQVIEHVYDPRRFLEGIRRHLLSGGHMVIGTPDVGSWWRRIMGHRWPSFKIPEHVVYFDSTTLTRVMEAVHLKKIQRLPFPHAFPLSLVARKLGLEVPKAVGQLRIWMPATTLALRGQA